MNFPCTGCGICCTKVKQAIDNAALIIADGVKDNSYVNEVAAFPYGTKEDGSCEMLSDGHLCMVYHKRPDICKIEVTWEKHHKENISRENFFISTAMLCNQLMKDGNAENLFIDVNKLDGTK